MKRRNSFNFLLLGISLLPLFFFILLSYPRPKTIFSLNELEIFSINNRRSYYSSSFLARMMENKLTLSLYKYQKNFFQGLDPNYYFFANHPRERAGIKETEKFFWIFLIPFLFGLFWQIKRKFWWDLKYFFIVLIIVSFFENIDRYLYFIFPFFFLTILFGFLEIFSIIRVKVKNGKIKI